MAVWELRDAWNRTWPTAEKLANVRDRMTACGDPDRLARRVPPVAPVADLPCLPAGKTRTHGEVHVPFSFEVGFDEVRNNLDACVDAVFGCLESEFLAMPKGETDSWSSRFSRAVMKP